jgi:hypothetical protein
MNSLADVISAAGLYVYAEVAMVIFVLVFVAVGVRVISSRSAAWDRAARLPLDDDFDSHAASHQPEA